MLYLLISLIVRLIGYSTGQNKDAHLVYRALASIKYRSSNKIQMFHTDRGSEFKNQAN